MSLVNEPKMLDLMRELWPLNRSITGQGLRESLNKLSSVASGLEITNIPSGEEIFDWKIPKEWRVNRAYIVDPLGKKLCDFASNNLHLVGYSIPFRGKISLSLLQEHLYSLPMQPDAIPYVTSYYREDWGFCISHEQRQKLIEGEYEIIVDTELFEGYLSLGEVFIPGCSKKEIFFSTYICHPSMANNELSGPVLAAFLVEWLRSLRHRRFSYRFVFVPETIGAIAYIHRNIQQLKESVMAGFNLTCVGDERSVGFLPTRNGNSMSDKVALSVLSYMHPNFKKYSWKDRGSDERQYCSPGVDLPIASIFRSKYGEYPEYHTSLDTIGRVVTEKGLSETLEIYKEVVKVIESNFVFSSYYKCEPQLGRRNLYPTISIKGEGSRTSDLVNVLSYCDGTQDTLDIANSLQLRVDYVQEILRTLLKHKLIVGETEEVCLSEAHITMEEGL